MLKHKILNPALILSALVLLLSACAGGKPPEEIVEGPVEEVVQPGAVEAARDEALAQEEKNHETRKKIFEAKTKLGYPTQEEEPAKEETPK